MDARDFPHLISAQEIAPDDRRALIAGARSLQLAASAAALPKLLQGKNLGLFSGPQHEQDAALFERAATELGGRVARISPDLVTTLNDENLESTARTLGRLYDAIECQGLPGPRLQRVRALAGVPVYDGIACIGHPSAALAAELGRPGTDADRRLRILQALLLSTLG